MKKIVPAILQMYTKIEVPHKAITVPVALLCGIFIFDLLFVIKPQLAKVNFLNKQIIQRRKDLGELKSDYARIEQYQQKSAALKTTVGDITKRFIRDDETAKLFGAIEQLANEQRIKILSMKPLTNFDKRQAKKWQEYTFHPLMVSISTRGGYHQIARFVNALESDQFLLKVLRLQFTPREDDLAHEVSLDVQTYVMVLKD
jgi:Tfp pilus assembly protein PilO